MREIATFAALLALPGLAACAADQPPSSPAGPRPAAMAPSEAIPSAGTGAGMQGMTQAPLAGASSVPGDRAPRGSTTSGTGAGMQGMTDDALAGARAVPGGGLRGSATSGTGFGMQGSTDDPIAGAHSTPGGGRR